MVNLWHRLMSKKALRERWQTPLNGDQLDESPFGLVNDKKDFRGVEFVRPLRNFEVYGSDFTNAYLKVGQFTHIKARESVFDGVNFDGTIFGDEFINCHFQSAILSLDFCDLTFESCDFSKVNFKKSTTNDRVVFSNVKFKDCDLSKVHFMRATFKNCIFKHCKTGKWTSFAYSKFVGCDVSEMDFGDAIMDDVVFE